MASRHTLKMDKMKKVLIFEIIISLWAGMALAAPEVSDLYFPQQWGLHNDGTQTVLESNDKFHTIEQKGKPGIDIGWSLDLVSQPSAPVVVAVIDSGMDASHPDLVGRMAPGAYDFLLNLPIVSDPLGHGTHISGIIAATANNNIGIAGVAPASVKVLPLRVLWAGNDPKARQQSYPDPQSPNPAAPNYRLLSDYVAQATKYAVAHGASVITMSLSWPKILDSANLRQALADAQAAGVLVVVAAGNDQKNNPTYPCSYPGVLCVGAVTNTGDLALFSNYGGYVDLLAPGDGILSTYPQKLESTNLRIQGYELMSGTSQAVPFIAGMAAVLKSKISNITVNEIKARLFVSALPVAGANSSIYGLANLRRALEATPQVVYQPNFKSLTSLPVDEDSLMASGNVSVTNLWLPATKVQAKVLIDGQLVGQVSIASIGNGQTFSIPWNYKFLSLEVDSKIHLQVVINDSSGKENKFSLDTNAYRSMEKIKNPTIIPVPNINANDWLASSNGFLFSKLSSVDSYPTQGGLPRYYRQLGSGPLGSLLEITDTNNAQVIRQVQVPGIANIKQVIHRNGHPSSWVITGYTQNPANPADITWEFYFLNESLQPFFGSSAASQWQIPVSNLVLRNFALPGSWIKSDGKMLPCFIDSGQLPAKDNFDELDVRHYSSSAHLYYLNPIPSTDVTKPVALELRALDNVTMRNRYPDLQIKTLIPGSTTDSAAGHLRVLVNVGSDLNASVSLWDVISTQNIQVTEANGWSALQTNGAPLVALSPGLEVQNVAMLNFLDSVTDSLAWTDTAGKYLGRSEFSFHSVGSVIASVIGVFDFPKEGRYWFATTNFSLVGYHQATLSDAIETQTTSLERETGYTGTQFSDLFSVVQVGTSENPVPGVYVDSTLVRGNQVAVAVWGKNGSLEKPLRYSLEVPANCVQMNPTQLVRGDSIFSMVLICSPAAGGVEIRILNL